jgi:hypothetical protein
MLMGRYNHLERFADVEPGLDRLQRAGHTMVVFSNGSPRMLEPLMASAGLDRWFDGFLSVDPVRTFKPSPRTYRYVADELGRPIGESRLISSKPSTRTYHSTVLSRSLTRSVTWWIPLISVMRRVNQCPPTRSRGHLLRAGSLRAGVSRPLDIPGGPTTASRGRLLRPGPVQGGVSRPFDAETLLVPTTPT